MTEHDFPHDCDGGEEPENVVDFAQIGGDCPFGDVLISGHFWSGDGKVIGRHIPMQSQSLDWLVGGSNQEVLRLDNIRGYGLFEVIVA